MNTMDGDALLSSLKEILEELEISSKEFGWHDMEESSRDAIRAKLGNYKTVSVSERTEGGGDFDGAQTVYHFTDHDVYIAIEGSYHSDYGHDFAGADYLVVEPVQVTTTQYLPKKK